MTDFVPSVFNTFVHMLIEDVSLVPRLGSLCCLFIGGEVISLSAVGIFRSLLPGTRIVNTYGPTEAFIGCVFHEVSDLDDEEVLIGRPIDNTYVALLDNDRELVVPGEIGEIYLGGDCLGAGYLHAPDRITDVFINNPFGEIPGSWLYPTGDLAYHRHDGQLIFVGRRDHTSAGGRR